MTVLSIFSSTFWQENKVLYFSKALKFWYENIVLYMSVDNFQLHTPNYKFRFILYLCLICSLKPFTVSSSVYMWYVLFIYFLFSGFLFLLCCVFMSLPARDDGFKESLKQYIHCYLETILLKWSKTAKLNLNFKIQGLISCACVDYPGISCRMLHLHLCKESVC